MKRMFTALLIISGLVGLTTAILTEGIIWLLIAIGLVVILIALPLNIVACNTSRFLVEKSKVEPVDADNQITRP